MELRNPEFRHRLEKVIGNWQPFGWAAAVGISKGAFSRIWNEGTIPAADILIRIRKFSGISIDWLLTGEGEMFSSAKHSQAEAKKFLLDFWFGYRESEEEKFWGKHYPADGQGNNIDEQPDMTIVGTVRKFVFGYNRGMFELGLIPDWVFTLLPSLSESEFEKWVREELKHRIEKGLPPIQEIVPLDQLPDLGAVLDRLIIAVTAVYGRPPEELPPRIGVSILRATIYPTMIRLGANDTRLPEVEEIETLLRLAIRLGTLPEA